MISVRPTRSSACPFTVVAQSDNEVGFFIGLPDNPEGLTVDLWDRDEDELLDAVGQYVRALIEGRVTVEARAGSSGGRATFALSDGALRRPRLRRWVLHRFAPY